MDAETREALLWAWATVSTIFAVAFFAYWRMAEHFYRQMRDGWRQEINARRDLILHVEQYATAKAERMVAEGNLVDALKQGAKPEAQALTTSSPESGQTGQSASTRTSEEQCWMACGGLSARAAMSLCPRFRTARRGSVSAWNRSTATTPRHAHAGGQRTPRPPCAASWTNDCAGVDFTKESGALSL
jgi:hypothetical protein